MTSITEKYKKTLVDEMEKLGVLGEMKSKLKSHIIEIVKKEKKQTKRKLEFELLTPFQRITKSKELMLLSHLIIEFMQFYELDYTLPIFKGETNIKESIKKETLIKDSLLKTEHDSNKPILLQIIESHLKEPKNSRLFEDQFNKKDREISYNGYSSGLGLLSGFSNKTSPDPLSTINLTGGNELTNTLNSMKTKKLAPLSFGAQNEEKTTDNETNEEDKGLSPFAKLLQQAKAKEKTEEKFNNTDVYQESEGDTRLNLKQHYNQDDYSTNNKETILNDDDIKEEILIETLSQEKDDPNYDKEKSSSLHNYTSSQTFGYDNSVTSYNLDFYDYVEDVEK